MPSSTQNVARWFRLPAYRASGLTGPLGPAARARLARQLDTQVPAFGPDQLNRERPPGRRGRYEQVLQPGGRSRAVSSYGACGDVRQALGVYVLGAIEAADHVLVERHLASCPPCTEELAGLAGPPAPPGPVPPTAGPEPAVESAGTRQATA